MRRILLIWIVACTFATVAGAAPPPPTEAAPMGNQQAPLSTAKADTPPKDQAQSQTPAQPQAKDDSRMKRLGMLLATLTAMGAIAVRRTRPQRP